MHVAKLANLVIAALCQPYAVLLMLQVSVYVCDSKGCTRVTRITVFFSISTLTCEYRHPRLEIHRARIPIRWIRLHLSQCLRGQGRWRRARKSVRVCAGLCVHTYAACMHKHLCHAYVCSGDRTGGGLRAADSSS